MADEVKRVNRADVGLAAANDKARRLQDASATSGEKDDSLAG